MREGMRVSMEQRERARGTYGTVDREEEDDKSERPENSPRGWQGSAPILCDALMHGIER